jgi:hypothetical protein
VARGRACAVVMMAAVAVAAMFVGAGSAPGAGSPCKAGVKKVPGGVKRTFCKARATVRVNGKTYALKNGECDLYPKYVVFSIGSVAKKGSFFALYIGKSPVAASTEPAVARDGTYKNGLIVLATPKVLAFLFDEVDLTVTLRRGRRAGIFVGTNPANQRLKRPLVRMSGSFAC